MADNTSTSSTPEELPNRLLHPFWGNFRVGGDPTGMHRSAGHNLQGMVASDRQTSYAYRPKSRAWTLGCWQDRGSWQALSSRCFPQVSGVLPWLLYCRPRDCVTLSEILAGANPSPELLQKENMDM